jgi:hypothetical protein
MEWNGMDTHKSAVRADRFAEFLAPWPRVANPEFCLRAWLSSVESADDEAAAFAARDRYLSSDEFSRGIVMDATKWLVEQKTANWKGRWPSKNISGSTPYRKDDYHA